MDALCAYSGRPPGGGGVPRLLQSPMDPPALHNASCLLTILSYLPIIHCMDDDRRRTVDNIAFVVIAAMAVAAVVSAVVIGGLVLVYVTAFVATVAVQDAGGICP